MSTTEGMGKIKPLSNSNYPEWAGEMKAWLMRNNLWRLVSGKEKQPSEEEKSITWEEKAEKAAGEIYLMVENDQRVHFRGSEDDPVKMWNLLEAAHLSKKAGARFNAYDNLFSIRKQEDENLVTLGVRIEKAMQTIQNLRTPGFTIQNLDEELQCMALIRALPDEYRHLSSSLLLINKLDKVTILEAFRSEELNRQRQSESVSIAKGGNGRTGKLAGSRERGEGQKKPWERKKETTKCFICDEMGHWARDCKRLKDWKHKQVTVTEGAKKAEVEKAAAVTEFAGQASAVSDFNSTTCNTYRWNTDTGATSTMTPHKTWIRNYKPYRVPVKLADHSIIYSEGIGSVCYRPLINGQQSRDIEFTRVLHVPALKNNLLSVLYLTKYKGIDVHISKSKMSFLDQNNHLLFTATIGNDDTGYLDGYTVLDTEHAHLVSISTLPLDLSLWHKRFGHHNYDDIKMMISKNLVDGLTLDSKATPDPICEPCLAGKMHSNPFPLSQNRAKELLELIHTDVHEIGVTSPSGYKYWISFIDDHCRFKILVPMKRKSDALAAFKSFKAYAENKTGKRIKCLRIDKGGEYMSNEFSSYLDACGIVRQYTCRNRPQQNGVAERANRLFAERIVALLNESGLSKMFWVECLAALVHVLNICPTSALLGKTPHEIWHDRKPDVSHLRVWGCLAYVHIQKDKREKLGSHMEKCIFIGYPDGYKGWKFYNPISKKVIISERAEFDERHRYDGQSLSSNEDPKSSKQTPDTSVREEDTYVYLSPLTSKPVVNDEQDNQDVDPQQQDEPIQPVEPALEPNNHHNPNIIPQQPPNPPPDIDNRPLALRRSKRTVTAPGEWWKVRHPRPQIPDSEDDDMEEEEGAQVVVSGISPDPTSYRQAINGEYSAQWKDAMLEEHNWHLENRTWTLMELPEGKKAISSKWVYRTKCNADGSIERYKARLVVMGNFQRPGQDFFETYASTLHVSTIRIVLALAAIEDMEL